ncbi:MAG: CheR family methyltransferase, partial [Thermoanaerobaculia bacterium]
MRDDDCVRFLQWALPRLGMRWSGFRKVRRQVCRRITRRMGELGLRSLREYRERLEAEPGEWRELDRLCRVTISRFWRDRGTFRTLEETVLPALAGAALETGNATLEAWSCGCASGEEAYT